MTCDLRPSGVLVTYFAERRFGFIRPDAPASADVFVHESELPPQPRIGDRVRYELDSSPGRRDVAVRVTHEVAS